MNVKKSVSVVFRVDADEKLGLGHLSRCRSLMLALADATLCRFAVVTNNPDIVRKFLPQVDVDLYAVTDIGQIRHANIAIIDVPDIAYREEESLRCHADLLVVIDDDGPGMPYQDVLLRPNLLDLPLPAGMPLNDYWSGSNCIILHPDFRRLANHPKDKESKAKKLFVCFGGSDSGGLTLRIIPVLKQLKQDMAIQIILGAAFVQIQAVIDETRDDSRFTVSRNISDMAERISQADIALISGGTLLYEACALGTPAVVISQNEAQAIEAGICAAAGAVIDLRVGRMATDEKILGALEKLLDDEGIRKSMARKSPEIVSPDGVYHVVSKLLSRVRKEMEL